MWNFVQIQKSEYPKFVASKHFIGLQNVAICIYCHVDILKQFMIPSSHVFRPHNINLLSLHYHHLFIFYEVLTFHILYLFSFKQIEWLHYHMQTVFKWNSNPFQYLIFCWNFIILHHLSIKLEITSIINKLLQNYFWEKYSRLKIFSGSWEHNWKERRHCEKI